MAQQLSKGALNCIESCMGVQPGEHVLIIGDAKRLRIAEALREAAKQKTNSVTLILLEHPDQRGKSPVSNLDDMKVLLSAIDAADVILTPFTRVEGELRPFRIAIYDHAKASGRLGIMLGIEEESFIDGGLTADCFEIEKFTDQLAEILSKAKEITIRSGTLTRTCELTIKHLRGWDQLGASDCGAIKRKGAFGNLPAGEAYVTPVIPSGINGDICITEFIEGVGPVTSPIFLIVVNGRVVNIEGGSEAELLKKALDADKAEARKRGIPEENVEMIAELGIGTNPKAKPGRVPIETEKLKHTIHIALGENELIKGKIKAPNHRDGVLKEATVVVNGKTIMEKGVFKPTEDAVSLQFEEDFETYNVAGIADAFCTKRTSGQVSVSQDPQGRRLLMKQWIDLEGRPHETKVGNDNTAQFAAKVWESLPIEDMVTISELAGNLAENKERIKKVLRVMEEYNLVIIEQRETVDVVKHISEEVQRKLEPLAAQLKQLTAVDAQTQLLVGDISADLLELSQHLNEYNSKQVLQIVEGINRKIDKADTNRITGTITFQPIPGIGIGVSKAVDVKEAFDTIKGAVNKIGNLIRRG